MRKEHNNQHDSRGESKHISQKANANTTKAKKYKKKEKIAKRFCYPKHLFSRFTLPFSLQ